jgi:hypothetical protein
MSRRSKKSKFRSVFEEETAKVLEGFEYEPYMWYLNKMVKEQEALE